MRRPATRWTRAQILRIYRDHPVGMRRLLARVCRRRSNLAGLDEMDLAIDRATEITDQNHVGGWRSVRDLARLASVDGRSRIVDLGSGLGGAARVLAHLHGCRVHGIDLSPKRCREARALNRLVGLDDLVTIECANLMRARVRPATFDVVWGQAAWSHVLDKERLVRRWSAALKPGGRIAMEDACLGRPVSRRGDAAALAALVQQWRSYLVTVDEWEALFERAGLKLVKSEDLTPAMIRGYRRLMTVSRHTAPPAEVASWGHAVSLATAGVIVYRRIIVRA